MTIVAKKTIIAKVLALDNDQRNLLEAEYGNYQNYIQGDKGVRLFAATKQQADRFLTVVRKTGRPVDPGKEYPLIIRRDTYKAETALAPFRFRIPVSGRRGGVEVPIGVPCGIPEGVQLRQAKLIRDGDDWYIHILIQKEVNESASGAFMAIDMGTRNLATVVCTWNAGPRFYGTEIRGIQAHYYKLRRTLAKKGAHGTIKKIGQSETRAVEAVLHAVSRKIVDDAARHHATIFVGDLKGLLTRARRSKLARRILLGFAFYKFYGYLRYKSEWAGVPLIAVNEAYTSIRCHSCGQEGLRVAGWFQCRTCGHEYNADYNGAMNILKRGMGYISMSGAASGTAQNPIG